MDRFTLTKVCVVDQVMPRATGLQVIRQLEGRNGLRVLLTGGVDHSAAVAAFNEGLIDRYAHETDSGTACLTSSIWFGNCKTGAIRDLTRSGERHLSPEQGIALQRSRRDTVIGGVLAGPICRVRVDRATLRSAGTGRIPGNSAGCP